MKVQDKPWYKKAEANYNRMAGEWNKLGGENKLYKDRDRFSIKYCYHKPDNREMVYPENRPPYCSKCGYCLPFAYDGV